MKKSLFLSLLFPLGSSAFGLESNFDCWVSGSSFAQTKLALPANTLKTVISLDNRFELSINNYEGTLMLGLRGLKDVEEISTLGADFHINRSDLNMNVTCFKRAATE